MVGLAVFLRDHSNDLVALEFGLERAAYAAVCARRQNRAVRYAVIDDGFLHQRRGWTDLHAGAARDALGIEEVVGACRHFGIEAPI